MHEWINQLDACRQEQYNYEWIKEQMINVRINKIQLDERINDTTVEGWINEKYNSGWMNE